MLTSKLESGRMQSSSKLESEATKLSSKPGGRATTSSSKIKSSAKLVGGVSPGTSPSHPFEGALAQVPMSACKEYSAGMPSFRPLDGDLEQWLP